MYDIFLTMAVVQKVRKLLIWGLRVPYSLRLRGGKERSYWSEVRSHIGWKRLQEPYSL